MSPVSRISSGPWDESPLRGIEDCFPIRTPKLIRKKNNDTHRTKRVLGERNSTSEETGSMVLDYKAKTVKKQYHRSVADILRSIR